MPWGQFDERKGLPIAAIRESVEREHLAEVEAPPHGERSWRYRTDGFPRGLAIVGIVVGFLLLIVPGVFALRSYRRWRAGEQAEPALAWSLAMLPVALLPAALLFPVLPVVAVVVFFLVSVPMFAFVGPRN